MTKLEHVLRSIYEADSRQESLDAWERYDKEIKMFRRKKDVETKNGKKIVADIKISLKSGKKVEGRFSFISYSDDKPRFLDMCESALTDVETGWSFDLMVQEVEFISWNVVRVGLLSPVEK